MKKIVFIVWASYHRRSELLAQHLGASIHYINYGRSGKMFQAPVRYLIQARLTWKILRKEQPGIIFVQNPPIFAVLLVAAYAAIFGAKYIIDSHTGAFLSSKWRWSVKLHRILSKQALMTIVHNESQGRLIENWGCSYRILGFTPGEYPVGDPYPLSERFNVAVICGYDADEPLEILFNAAHHLKNASFYLTGDSRRIDQRLLTNKPENIHLTGYLPYGTYIGLLRGVGAIMDLVDNEHTLLMGAFEAVSLGTPLILSDWPLLRAYFSQGAVYVPNTIGGIYEGVLRAQTEQASLRSGVLKLQEQLNSEWNEKFAELQHILDIHGNRSEKREDHDRRRGPQ